MRLHRERWLAELCATTDLTPLLQQLDLVTLSLLACASHGWSYAVEIFRAEETRIPDRIGRPPPGSLGYYWDWAKSCMESFQTFVLPRYLKLQHLNLGVKGSWAPTWGSLGVHSWISSSAVHSLSSWPQLRTLTVEDINADVAPALFTGAAALLHLRVINVSFNGGADLIDDDLMRFINACPRLRSIRVAYGSWRRPFSETVEEGSPEQGLHQFVAQGVFIRHTLDCLAERAPNLRVLRLDQASGATPARVAAIARGCPRLEELVLNECLLIDDAAIIDVASGCPQLKVLDLEQCVNIGDAGICAVASGCPQLKILNLKGCHRIGDASANALPVGCPRLQTVDVRKWREGYTCRHNQITSNGLTSLLSLRALTACYINESPSLPITVIDGALAAHPNVTGLNQRITIKVATQDGSEIFFKCRMTKPLVRLMNIFCTRNGVAANSVRFLFDGCRINGHQTPEELEMEDGDVIDVMVEQQGWMPWAAPLATTPLLCGTADPTALAPSDVALLKATAVGPHAKPGRREVVIQRPVLAAADCATLMEHADRMMTHSDSATHPVSVDELVMLLNRAALQKIYALGEDAMRESRPRHARFVHEQMPWPRLALRRRNATAAHDARIAFHRDGSRVVVHVPLNEDFVGGKLMLARGDRVHALEPAPGLGTAIDNAVVHAVSAVTAGSRYVLLAAFRVAEE